MLRTILLCWLLVTTIFALPPDGKRTQSPSHHDTRPSEWQPGPTNGTDALAKEGLKKLKTFLRGQKSSYSPCTLHTAYRRREWDTLRPHEKRDYLRAVRCLQTKPSISGDLVPGARSRFDDFVATHLNQTLKIHSTANFLTWHRYYVYIWEKALREECDYQGYQPYVNWGRLSNDVKNAPVFDGSDLSIGGNGVYSEDKVPFGFPVVNTSTVIELNPQGGGGCITNGPFKNLTVNLGPLGGVGYNHTTPNPLASGLGYNPRCIRRDLSLQSASGCSDANSTHLITTAQTIAAFQDELQGPYTYGVAQLGVHGAGHFLVGGDPGGDFYISSGDPWFWFHHAQVDRTYWIWQNQKLPQRLEEIAGTLTLGNVPPSRNATLDDIVQVGVNDGFRGITIREALSTMGEKFCYIYE